MLKKHEFFIALFVSDLKKKKWNRILKISLHQIISIGIISSRDTQYNYYTFRYGVISVMNTSFIYVHLT